MNHKFYYLYRQICGMYCRDEDERRNKNMKAALLFVCIMSLSLFFAPGLDSAFAAFGRGTYSEKREIPIYSVNTQGEKTCAITFDAAWGATRTEAILDILDQHEVKATFFLTNIWMKDYPQLVKEIARRGHELGLHSDSHPNLTQVSADQLEAEIENNRRLLHEITGLEGKAFRPPFGAYDNRLVKTLKDKGLYPVQWSVDSLDWKNLTAEEMLAILNRDISPGGIVLFHNDGLHTPEVLPDFIRGLKEQGYKFAKISDLVYAPPYTVDSQGVQHHNRGADPDNTY